MDPLLIKTTHSTKFLLPLFVNENVTYKDIMTFLVNGYIGDSRMPEYDGMFVIALNANVCYGDNFMQYFSPDFMDFVVAKNDDDIYDYLIIYEIPDDYQEDYMHFLSGKYHLLSNKAKEKILKFWNVDETSLLYLILNQFSNLATDVLTRLDEKLKRSILWGSYYNKIYDRYLNNKSLYEPPTLNKEIYGLNFDEIERL